MLLKRCLWGMAALGGAWLPLLCSWLLLGTALDARAAASPEAASPNPIRSPAHFLGPVDLLVAVDLSFAGWINLWLVPGAVVLLGLVLWAMGVPVLRKGTALAPTCPRASRLVTASVAVGLFLAVPWLLALVRVLSGAN